MKKSSNTILIGPTGFLGPSFLESDSSIVAVGRGELPKYLTNDYVRIVDENDFEKLAVVEFDKVIFLIGSSDHSVLNSTPSLAIEKNVIPLQKFLFWLKSSNKQVKKIVTFTTMLQYDTKLMRLPCDEKQALNPYVNNYVLSKFFAEQVSQQYREYFDIIDVRMSNVYGPTRLYRPDIVPSLIWSILEGRTSNVWTKKPKRDFIFVRDAIMAVMRLLDSDYSGVVNLGTGESNSVGKLCDILTNLSGVEIADENRIVDGHMDYRHDITLLKNIIGEFSPLAINDGLERTYNRMREYYFERN
jgi:nucleoside-diphosphate-sugar epimerase